MRLAKLIALVGLGCVSLSAGLRPRLVAISVPNLEDSLRWYQDNLGFKLVEKVDLPQNNLKVAFIELDRFRLELVELKGSFSIRKYVPDIDNPALLQGMGKLAFEVDDIDAMTASLKKKGVKFQIDLRRNEKTGERWFIVLDNNGNWIEFLSPAGPA